MTKEIYILNVKKSESSSNYKIEIIQQKNDSVVKFNRYHFKFLKGHNIKRINAENFFLQTFNFYDDIKSIVQDLHDNYQKEFEIEKTECNFLVNWCSL